MVICNSSALDVDFRQMILDNISGGMHIAKVLYDDHGVPNDYVFIEVNTVFAKIIG